MSKELIEQLAKEHGAYPNKAILCSPPRYEFTLDQLESFAKAYAQTQEQDKLEGQSNWISVKDRLPNDGTEIFGVNSRGEVWTECFDSTEPLGAMVYWMENKLPAAPIESGVKG